MDHGDEARWNAVALENALALLIATFEHNKLFFSTRLPQSYEQLMRLVRHCRQHRRTRNQAHTQAEVQQELQRLFGVRVSVPRERQLSLLAGLVRHVLLNHIRVQPQLAARGGVQVLINEFHRHLNVAVTDRTADLIALDAALNQLACRDMHGVRLMELRYFARLGTRDIALELHTTVAAVERDLRCAKAWLLACFAIKTPGGCY